MELVVIPILYSVVVINLILSLMVVFRGRKNSFGLLFGIMSMAVAIWSFAIIGFYTESLKYEFNWIALTHSSALLSALILLYFSLSFPNKIIKSSIFLLFMITPFLVVVYYLFFSNFILGNITGISYQINSGYIYYEILLGLYFLASYIALFLQYKAQTSVEKKHQIKYVFIGAICASTFGMLTNLILPAIKIFDYTWLGPIFTLILVAFIFIAILKYNLFNIKTIITELISVVLIVAFSIEIFIEKDITLFIVKILVLLFIIIFTYILIKGVYKEIEQKEKIEKLAEELKQINVGQNSMIHFMNHQIKGRFGVAKNIFAELLSEDYGKMPPETVPLIEKGLEETNTGINYVLSILKGATAENGSLQYDKQPMDFKNLVEEVVRGERDKAEKKGLKFSLNVKDGNYAFVGDALQLGEAVRNLIDNSINYTLTGSILMKLDNKEKSIVFEVIDTGVGITPEDMGNLFKAGGRGANSLKVNVNSTGYGLVFVKNVVEAHGGKVWAESRGEGKGSSFYIELPKTK